MEIAVGLVSETSFRVPGPGVADVFGVGRSGVPDSLARALPDGGATVDGSVYDTTADLVAVKDDPEDLLATEKTARARAVISEQEAYSSLHRQPVAPMLRPTVPGGADGGPSLASVTAIGAARTGDPSVTDTTERDLDAWWDALCGNDPDTVLEHLTTTFSLFSLPVTPVRLRGRVLDIAVVTPSRHLLPRHTVGLHGGTLSIRTASAAHCAWLHRQVVAGIVFWAARQALADAPGVSSVRVHALSVEHRGHYDDVSVVGVSQLDREAVDGADLSLDAETLLMLHSRGLQWQTGGLHASLQSLPLSEAPALTPLFGRLCRTTAAALA